MAATSLRLLARARWPSERGGVRPVGDGGRAGRGPPPGRAGGADRGPSAPLRAGRAEGTGAEVVGAPAAHQLELGRAADRDADDSVGPEQLARDSRGQIVL